MGRKASVRDMEGMRVRTLKGPANFVMLCNVIEVSIGAASTFDRTRGLGAANG